MEIDLLTFLAHLGSPPSFMRFVLLSLLALYVVFRVLLFVFFSLSSFTYCFVSLFSTIDYSKVNGTRPILTPPMDIKYHS